MKKFKIISTCASLLLMVALLVFGVYAATSVSFSVSSTVSFKCENVFIKVTAGLGESVLENPVPVYYYSKPTGDQKNVTELATKGLDAAQFEDEKEGGNVITYYLEITSLHGMDINLMLGYNWEGISKYNIKDTTQNGAVEVSASYKTKEENGEYGNATSIDSTTPTIEANGKETRAAASSNMTFKTKSTTLFIIKLTLKDKAMVYALTNAKLTIKFNAAIDPVQNIDKENTTQGN